MKGFAGMNFVWQFRVGPFSLINSILYMRHSNFPRHFFRILKCSWRFKVLADVFLHTNKHISEPVMSKLNCKTQKWVYRSSYLCSNWSRGAPRPVRSRGTLDENRNRTSWQIVFKITTHPTPTPLSQTLRDATRFHIHWQQESLLVS